MCMFLQLEYPNSSKSPKDGPFVQKKKKVKGFESSRFCKQNIKMTWKLHHAYLCIKLVIATTDEKDLPRPRNVIFFSLVSDGSTT